MIAENPRFIAAGRPRLSASRWAKQRDEDDVTENGKPSQNGKPRSTFKKVKEHKPGLERPVLIGMIMNDEFLAAIAPGWPKRGDGLFASKWSNMIGSWCCEHHAKHGTGPGRDIEGSRVVRTAGTRATSGRAVTDGGDFQRPMTSTRD